MSHGLRCKCADNLLIQLGSLRSNRETQNPEKTEDHSQNQRVSPTRGSVRVRDQPSAESSSHDGSRHCAFCPLRSRSRVHAALPRVVLSENWYHKSPGTIQ